MMTVHKSIIAISLALFATANAATVIVLGGTPTVDGADIANLNTTVTDGDLLNGDRGYAGQTFTTGSNAAGYTISSISFYQTRSIGSTGGRFRVRLGTISGTDFTAFYTDETADEANNFYTLSGTGTDWMQLTFATPQSLSANTTYAIDIGRGDGGNYIAWGESGNDLTSESSYITSSTYNLGPTNPITLNSSDRIFHLDMTAIPEPSVALLSGLGVMLLLRRRKR